MADGTIEMLEQIRDTISAMHEELSERMERMVSRLDATNKGLERLEAGLNGTDERLDRVERGLSELGAVIRHVAHNQAEHLRLHSARIDVLEAVENRPEQ